MKALFRLVVLFSLMLPVASTLVRASDTDAVRERLRAFGQVCRAGVPCPAETSGSVAEGSHWQSLNPAGTDVAQAGESRVQSPWVAADIGWPEIAARIAVAADGYASMYFTHLDLAEGQDSRYGPWEDHWVTLIAGEREQAVLAREPNRDPHMLLLGRGAGNFIAQAVEDGAADTLLIAMHYRGRDRVAFPFPLQGAATALHGIGLVDEPAAAATDGMAVAEADAVAIPATLSSRSGQEIYDAFCFACHATAVAEAPLFGSLEQWQARIDKGMDVLVATSLSGLNGMPQMGACIDCTEDEMRDAIQYMINNAR